MEYRLTPVTYDMLPGWKDDDPSSLFPSMARASNHIRNVKPYRKGRLGISAASLEKIYREAEGFAPADAAEARDFIEKRFRPFRIRPANGADGFVTAFYEPEVEVSAKPDETWCHPFYRRPDDLVDLDDENRPAGMDAGYAFGLRTETGIDYYPDRQAIDRGWLAGRGLEIAWARSKVDVFFAHVQGAARLVYRDGTVRRITYAAKAGHPFTGIGRHLVESGELDAQTVSMQSIRKWLADHPQRVDEVLWKNRSYIFFREAEVDDPRLGPIAAAKIPLEPMRSIAVDKQIHTFSSLFYVVSPTLTHLTDGQPLRRLMMALDTGTAIVGPARGDIFTGSGEVAGELAGTVRNAADFYVLVPSDQAELLDG